MQIVWKRVTLFGFVVVLTLLLVLFAACSFLVSTSSSVPTDEEILSGFAALSCADDLTVNGTEKTIVFSVEDATAEVLLSSVRLKNAQYTVYADEEKTNAVSEKLVLLPGENVFYVVFAGGGTQEEYTLTITRKGVQDDESSDQSDDTSAHKHTFGALTKGVLPTCVEDGNVAYYYCNTCNHYFDETKKTQLSESDLLLPALGHTLVSHDGQSATCTQDGWMPYDTCSLCEYTTYEIISAKGHDYAFDSFVWDNYSAQVKQVCTHDASHTTYVAATITSETTTEAGCEENGIRTYVATCDTHRETKEQTIPAKGHVEVIKAAKVPTCTESGWTKETSCSVCHKVLVARKEIAPRGHLLSAHEGKEATCSIDGWEPYETCSRCEYTSYELIPAKGHDYLFDTFVWDGHSAQAKCVCQNDASHTASFDATIASNITTEASCVTAGVLTYTASYKNNVETKTESISPKGHVEVTDEAELPTCTKEGKTEGKHCSVCTNVLIAQEPIPALGHSLTHHDPQAATCTAVGWDAYDACDRCEYSTYEEISALGHDLSYYDGQDPTCEEAGWLAYETCSRCEHTTYEAIPAKGHDYLFDSFVWDGFSARAKCLCSHNATHIEYYNAEISNDITSPPGCLQSGVRTYTATYDLHTGAKTESVPALGHTAGEWTVKTEPSCLSKGVKHKLCIRCGTELETGEISALGHQYGVTHHESTCIAYAYDRYDCDRCDAGYSVTTGSEYSAHVYEAYTCRVCQRDELLDYISDFTNHGNSSSDLIQINSKTELILFLDYLYFYLVTSYKYIDYPEATVSNLSEVIHEASNKKTSHNWSITYTHAVDGKGNLRYIAIKYANSGDYCIDRECTITPESGEYERTVNEQLDFLMIDRVSPARADNYEAFPYLSRIYSASVTTSNQLFFAFEHGYRPIPTSGSPAEEMLERAKEVCRDVISDEMNDVEKVYAIMQWIVANVNYDYGAFNAEESDENFCGQYGTAWCIEGVFRYGMAVCDGIAKTFCVLAGIEDIKCIRLTGNKHAWNKVYIDAGTGEKKWFVVDATHANGSIKLSGVKYEILTLGNYMISDEEKRELGYVSDNYADGTCVADTDKSPYAYLHFGEAAASEENDFIISNISELNEIMSFIVREKNANMSTKYYTAQLFFEESFCSADSLVSSRLNSALSNAHYKHGWSYAYRRETYGLVSGYVVTICLYN